jgi:flagellar basal-body rod modification protein FlgD
MSTSPIGLNSASNTSNNSTNPTSAPGSVSNENVFLQLLVAQLKYQDPSQPTDGTQFVSELAQFSDLSNTTNMSSDLDTIKSLLQTSATAAPAPTSSAQTQTQANNQAANQTNNS